MATEAVRLEGFGNGLGEKAIKVNSGGAQWVLPIPVGTVSIAA